MNFVATYLSLFPFPYSQVYGSLENQQSFHVETMVKINDLLAKKKKKRHNQDGTYIKANSQKIVII